jgi:hypothetical protein
MCKPWILDKTLGAELHGGKGSPQVMKSKVLALELLAE